MFWKGCFDSAALLFGNGESMAKKVIYMLDRFNDRLIWAVKYFLCAVLTLQVCLIFVSVVMRYFLNRPLSWSDEMATFMLVYVTFLGTYVASNTGHLAKVELFISLFKGPLHTAAKILSRIFSAGLVGWIGFYGTKMYFSNIIQNQVSSAMQIPMRFVWWILPVTMWLLLFRKCWDFCIYLFPEVTEMNMRGWIREG